MIHDAEMDVEVARVDVEKAREKLAQLRLALREKRAEGLGEGRYIKFVIAMLCIPSLISAY